MSLGKTRTICDFFIHKLHGLAFLTVTFIMLFSNLSAKAEVDFNSFFASHNAVMILIEPKSGEIVKANQAASDFYGHPLDTLENMKISEINMLTPKQVAEEIQLAKTESRNFFIFRHMIADGTVKTVEVYSKPLEYQGKTVLFSVIHDVSDKKTIEESLAHYQNRLENMIDEQSTEIDHQYMTIIVLLTGAGVIAVAFIYILMKSLHTQKNITAGLEEAEKIAALGNWSYDVSTGLMTWSNGLWEIFGREKIEPLTYEIFTQWITPEYRTYHDEVMGRMLRLKRNEKLENFQYDIVLPSGEIKTVEVQLQVEFTETGQQKTLFGTVQDITEKIRISRQLMASEQRFKDFSSASSDWFWEMDQDLRFSFFSGKLEERSGLLREDLLGKTRKEIGISDVDDEKMKEHFDTLDQHKEFKDFVYSNITKDETFWLSISGLPVFDNQGKFKGYRGTGKNITTQIENANELEEAKKKADNANHAKSEFLASMSHELRTPMTTVIGFADLILQDKTTPSIKENAERIQVAAKSLLGIVNDILDMSKLEAGKLEIEHIDFDLKDLLDEILHMFNNDSHTKKALSWDLQIGENVPQFINSDPTRIRQILINLVGNAHKFTQEGKISISCTIFENNQLEFKVVDTGIGMNDDVTQHIFEEFTQADASISRKYAGTGLGLTICKRLVKLLGGKIDVESELGAGSTFWFKIPFSAAKTNRVKTLSKNAASEIESKRALNILVAEDVQVNQILIKALLEKYGHNVTTVDNGLEAVTAHKNSNFDVILMDIRMPEMDGIEATQEIRNMTSPHAQIPIIAATADATTEHVEDYLNCGMNGFISKPYDINNILTTLNQVMDEEIHALANSA
ncbi:PAS domain S-box protein [Curvivirga aplysinae]|uniref:PAS domain S-box protein n=1 Tax=Curvivirga aplysinae TaxID=2529852 RepID=UPI001C3FD600|nr:PAS domain S-box protein [Curvivirga aplysinae]